MLGEREAQRRLDELLGLLDQPDIDYVSVKISAVASQLNHFAHADSLHRVTERLRVLIEKASSVQPPTFVNFDMEEYNDLDLTLDAFMSVLGEEPYRGVDAGIVLQADLPDAFPAMARLALAIMHTSMHRLFPIGGHWSPVLFNAVPHLDRPDRRLAQTHI